MSIRENPSLRVALDWLRISTAQIVTVATLTQGARRIALISRDMNSAAIDTYFAAKQELHARFTADQKLGNLWSRSAFGLRLRPAIADFLAATQARPQEAPAAIALSMFGPIDETSIAVMQ